MFLLTSGLLLGGDFWDDKEFTEWSLKDVTKMMTRSPWAKVVNLSLSNPRPPGGIGGRSRRGGIGGRPRGLGRGGVIPSFKLMISWRSALPIKQAIVRDRMGTSMTLPSGAREFLDQQEEFYAVAVAGFPARIGQMLENSPRKAILDNTFLKRKKGSIAPDDFLAQKRGTLIDILFFFPKSANITVGDKDIELIMKLGPRTIKKKFKLKDMVLNGNLEL